MILDKSKIKSKLLQHPYYYSPPTCFICKAPILRDEVEKSNFEKVNKKFAHTTCIKKVKKCKK